MSKYHINSNGDPGICKVTTGACPFGDSETEHFKNPEEARVFYENKNNTITVISKDEREDFNDILEKIEDAEENYQQIVMDRGWLSSDNENNKIKKVSKKALEEILDSYYWLKKDKNYLKLMNTKNIPYLRFIIKSLPASSIEPFVSIAKNPNLDYFSLDMLAAKSLNFRRRDNIFNEIIKNKKTSSETLDMIYYSKPRSVSYASSHYTEELKSFCKNSNTSDYVLNDIIKNGGLDRSKFVKDIFEKREKVNLKLQYEMLKDDESVNYLTKNIKVESNILGVIYERNKNKYLDSAYNKKIMKNLLNNPNTPKQIKDEIIINSEKQFFKTLK